MKKRLFSLTLLLFLAIVGTAQPSFSISHGPYLQEVTGNGATFVFTTSAKAFSSIELRKQGNDTSTYCYRIQNGLKAANDTFHHIRAERLDAGGTYQYRIHSKEILSFQPYKVTFGDSIVSPWYAFKTVNPRSKGGSLFVTSDTHNDPKKLETLLELCDYQTCDAFFYAGDVMNYMETMETPFKAFIDVSVRKFATSIPFEVVRGNHETRGKMARLYPKLFPKKDGHIYGSYLLGDIMIVMLDCGEDKPDTQSVYAGLVDFDNYRSEQAEWLKQLVRTKEFKKARYRIVISHFPMTVGKYPPHELNHGMDDLTRKCLPILNNAHIDLMVSGHTHKYAFIESFSYGNHFPILIGSSESAARLDIAKGKISIKAVDRKGNLLLRKEL